MAALVVHRSVSKSISRVLLAGKVGLDVHAIVACHGTEGLTEAKSKDQLSLVFLVCWFQRWKRPPPGQLAPAIWSTVEIQ